MLCVYLIRGELVATVLYALIEVAVVDVWLELNRPRVGRLLSVEALLLQNLLHDRLDLGFKILIADSVQL